MSLLLLLRSQKPVWNLIHLFDVTWVYISQREVLALSHNYNVCAGIITINTMRLSNLPKHKKSISASSANQLWAEGNHIRGALAPSLYEKIALSPIKMQRVENSEVFHSQTGMMPNAALLNSVRKIKHRKYSSVRTTWWWDEYPTKLLISALFCHFLQFIFSARLVGGYSETCLQRGDDFTGILNMYYKEKGLCTRH